MDLAKLRNCKARMVHVNPSHRFLHRLEMPLEERRALLQWAEDCEGIIIEDDFEAEFRYRDRPLPALAAMQQGEHVIYLSGIE